ncbi:protein tyrosine phosphatase receptor type C-associated protein [Gallus gallus]|uniref:protein tyrosine phosphatase receptor type C-associated protein n=1 Tax=Gallus gallus TaxID=9031 RepID=UPI001F00A05C|nr:protein tyrosine phosphatase receptor type C-associated protein [Gallus gallus]
MDAARRPAAALLLLAGLAAAGEPATSRSDQAVGALLGLLLCLAVGLALAWRHLCRQSDGRYHPRPAGRRALAVLRGRWRQLRGRESAAEPDGEGDEAPEAEELMPWGAERQQRQEEEEEEEEEKEEEEGGEEAAPQEEEEEEKEEEKEEDEEEEEEEQRPAEQPHALPGDAHSLAGTAAWGDARPHDSTAL